MKKIKTNLILLTIFIPLSILAQSKEVKTIALWAFDEQIGIYPSCVLSDVSDNYNPLVLGSGGQIVQGKYGNALEPIEQPKIKLPESTSTLFGMVPVPVPEGRTVEPMNWRNANFSALMTSGENHLRKEFKFTKPTESKLNLGNFDWTVEFWFYPNNKTGNTGTVFEIGKGPRGENNHVTKLSLSQDLSRFVLYNEPSNSTYELNTNLTNNSWQHLAFVFNSDLKVIQHYINGKKVSENNDVTIESLNIGDEDYMSIGRDGLWNNPLQGKVDELRFSAGIAYKGDFIVPQSFSPTFQNSQRKIDLKKGEPLLFAEEYGKDSVIDLGSRKHLFIDDVFISEYKDVMFTVNPPRLEECVIDNIKGSFRKHLNVVEDEDGLLRMYNAVDADYLAVRVSSDGINWEIPKLPNGNYRDHTNIVIHESTGMGVVFIDPNGPPEERWKYLTGYNESGIYIYTSPDGYNFKRVKTAILPHWPGSQSNVFYDEQQQKYIAYHRADFAKGVGGATQREFVYTETQNVTQPWPFYRKTQEEGLELAKKKRVKNLLPFYLDNGLLTPGGFGHEYPVAFGPTDDFDPTDTDVYVPKAMKYPWAPDTYLAFPIIYFHYKRSFPVTRATLYDKKYKRGSGPLETQLWISRDAKNWKPYPRPVYVGNGKHAGKDVNTAYMAHGMIKRGNEIWQYYFGESQYHSTHVQRPEGNGVYRVAQRLDGFVSIDSPYEKEAYVITKPFIFNGNRLLLNIDTDAAGYAQVGFLDESGKDIEGFSVDDCIYINGDFIEAEVEWMKNRGEIESIGTYDKEKAKALAKKVETSKDVSELEGKTVQLIFRMRGSKLYAMQFINK